MQAKSKQFKEATRWMNLENIRRLRFWDVTFPGTHNSATWCCYFNKESKWSIENNAFIKLYVVCQKLTVYQQLACGIRFLDLRVCKPYGRKKEPYCAHNGFLTVPFRKVLGQIRLFCTRNTSEVIIISIRRDVSHLNDMKSLSLIESDFLVALLLRCYLGPALTENVTIGELADRNQRVIYFFEEQERYLPPGVNSNNFSSSGDLNVMLSKKFWRCIDDKQKENRGKKTEKSKNSVSSKTIHIPEEETTSFQENTKVLKKKKKLMRKGSAKKTNTTGNETDNSITKNVVETLDSRSGRKATKHKNASDANDIESLMSIWLKKNISNLWYPGLESLPKNVYKGIIGKDLNKTYTVKEVNSGKIEAKRIESSQQDTKKASLEKSKQVLFDISPKVKCIEKKSVKPLVALKNFKKNKKSVMAITEQKPSKPLDSNTQKRQLTISKAFPEEHDNAASLQHMCEKKITKSDPNRSICENRQKEIFNKSVSSFLPVGSKHRMTTKDNLLVKCTSTGLNPVFKKNYQTNVQRNMDEPSTIRSSESKKEICEFIPINGVPVATFGDRKSSKRFSIIEDLMNQTDTPEILSETVEKYINSESTIKTKKKRLKKGIKRGVYKKKATRLISLSHQLRSRENYHSKTLTKLKSQRSKSRMGSKNGLSYIALNRLVSRANICGGGYFHAMLTPFMCGATRMFKSWSETSEANPINLCAKLVKWSMCYGSTRPRVPFVLRILAGEVTPPSFQSISRIYETVHFWTSCYISRLVSNHSGLEAYANETHRLLLESVLTDAILNNINCITHDFADQAVTSRIIDSNNFVSENE